MKRVLTYLGALLALVLLGAACAVAWYIYSKQPQRSGTLTMPGFGATVSVRYDERGVPHIHAENTQDMYRALGYVHAQDRLFQMEMMRRMANGEMAEVLGPNLLETDRLMRTVGIGEAARNQADALDPQLPSTAALAAYIDGVNLYQARHRSPIEFDILHIPRRPFTVADSLAVQGYFAYGFALGLKTAPLLTYIRDKLGPRYLAAFDTDWHPEGAARNLEVGLKSADWNALERVATISQQASEMGGLTAFQGSNAWAISGRRTASGKPILAGDPHMGFAAPAFWYEAQLNSPGFDLYGHFMALTPTALLGHNADFGWTLTLLGNADMDLVAEQVNPQARQQIAQNGEWVALQSHTETIHVKGAPDAYIKVRRSAHGPIISDVVDTDTDRTPIALWWVYQQAPNHLPEALYALNRAATREQARAAASQIHAPGMNIVWANRTGDIGWWVAGQIPQRPIDANPAFILSAEKGEANKGGYYNFTFNPQEENPVRGYLLSANAQPSSGIPIPGFYSIPDRFIELNGLLQDSKKRWTSDAVQALQNDACNAYPKRILDELLPVLDQVLTDANERAFMEPLRKWDGCYTETSVAATLFSEFSYQLTRQLFADKLSEDQFQTLLQLPALDHALPRVAADVQSPWWDNTETPQTENRYESARLAWSATLAHLEKLYGTSLLDWTWGKTHQLTHLHLLGNRTPFAWMFNVGPFYVPGGRETPAHFSGPVGPAPWAVAFGPSTRTIVDFAEPSKALSINPVGQSGVWFDRYYADQARPFAQGEYQQAHSGEADVRVHTRSTLLINPASVP